MQTQSELVEPTTARAFISFEKPSEDFWSDYRQLWENSQTFSAFQAPAFLQFLHQQRPDQTATFQYYEGAKLMGAVCMTQQDKQWSFLSNVKSDHNYFVLHKDCDEKTELSFFAEWLKHCKTHNLQVVLDYFPEGKQYDILCSQLQKQKGLKWIDCMFSVCPFIVSETADELFQLITRSKRLRRNVRRLKGDENVKIEFYQDDTDLSKWVNDYCQLHVQRWQNTPTLSIYEDPAAIRILEGYLKSWMEDGLLLRSSIMMEGKRISLNIGLIEKDTLIGHGQAYDPSYNSYSPGRTLLLLIGEWMQEKGIAKFDMGDGKDPYKTDFANEELKTHRISISKSFKVIFLLKAYGYKFFREDEKLLNFYRRKVKPLFTSS